MKNTIRVLDGFGKSLEVILPKLRDGYIVPGSDTARGLALENPDAFFLSQSGECFHNVTVTGGKQRAEGPLSMKRELREVLRQLEDLERALRDEEMRVLTLGKEIKEFSSLLERLEGEKRDAEHQSMTSGHMLQQLDSEMSRVMERMRISQARDATPGGGAGRAIVDNHGAAGGDLLHWNWRARNSSCRSRRRKNRSAHFASIARMRPG